MRPGVALVRNEAMEHANGARLIASGLVLQPSRERRRVGEVRMSVEHAADFEVRVDARIEHTKELQDQTVAINHRRVGLLGLERARLAWAFAITPQAAPRRHGSRDKLAALTVQAAGAPRPAQPGGGKE